MVLQLPTILERFSIRWRPKNAGRRLSKRPGPCEKPQAETKSALEVRLPAITEKHLEPQLQAYKSPRAAPFERLVVDRM